MASIDAKLKGTKGLKLVGHSQGGLRAISYAGYLRKVGRAADLDTVISIGGQVLGFSPLVQGTGVLRQKVNSAADTLHGGVGGGNQSGE